MFAGAIYWGSTGYKYVTESDGFKEIVEPLIGNGIFSIEGIVFAIIYLSLYFYPMIVWTLICGEIAERGFIKEILFDTESWYLWLAPFTIILLVGLFILVYVARTLLIVMVFVVFPLCVVINYIYRGILSVTSKS